METIIEKLIESIENGKNNEIDYDKKELFIEFLERMKEYNLLKIDIEDVISEISISIPIWSD